MDSIPVEVIGLILSRLRAARDVVIASTTCRKWLEARRNCIYTISFDQKDWPVYMQLTTIELENLITHTILQTAGLECLTICMGHTITFSVDPVIGWLMHTRENLRYLRCNFRTAHDFNILEECGWQKLEVFVLSNNTIKWLEPINLRFPRLRSISLRDVDITGLDLNLLLAACPKLKSLSVVAPNEEQTMQLSSPTLEKIYVSDFELEKFILEADNLVYLCLEDADIQRFELVSKGLLKHLNISRAKVIHLDIGGENIQRRMEVINVGDSTIKSPSKLLEMISTCWNLRRLRLWYVEFGDDESDEITVDLRTSASSSFPRLTHICLTYNLSSYVLQGSSRLLNVLVLELGWRVNTHGFAHWVNRLLGRCPNLKKLIIQGTFSAEDIEEELPILAIFSSSIVRLMRKYARVDVQFKYNQLESYD